MSLQNVIDLLGDNDEAALGTLKEGQPFVSAVGYIYEPGGVWGELYFLMSDLAQHAKNLKMKPSMSLLVTEKTTAPIHEKKRVSLTGEAALVREPVMHEKLKKRYIERFPNSGIFFELPDFHFYSITVQEFFWIGGFGKAQTIRPES